MILSCDFVKFYHTKGQQIPWYTRKQNDWDPLCVHIVCVGGCDFDDLHNKMSCYFPQH